MKQRLINLAIGIVLAMIIYRLDSLEPSIRSGLAITTLIAVLWITETFHVAVTALLVPLLAILFGIFNVQQALVHFAHPIIFLFMGGFALATALQNQKLDQRIADGIIQLARGRLDHALWLTFATTGFISMWISNTATTAMMLPLVLGLLSHLSYERQPSLFWYALLGVAYSANIGGMGTLVGSPPNAIAAANADIRFSQWLSFGLPVVLISLPLIIFILGRRYQPDLTQGFDISVSTSPLTPRQKLTLLVFALTVTGWLLSTPLSTLFGISSNFDSVIALCAIILLFALRLMDWDTFQHSTNWGVLILFGGGLTLSAILQDTGTSAFLGQLIIEHLGEAPLYFFLLALAFFVVMLTEITSNTASSALLIPVFIPVAASFSLSPEITAAVIALCASCAFMLPVATPPNALVYSTGFVPQQQMMKTGMLLNLLMAFLISLGAWLLF